MSSYAMPYKDLGIDIDKAIADAKIAQYAVDIGTNADGDVDGLGYQATGGAFIYRRSIAKEVFGTDDPAQIAEILGAGTNSWDKFWEAAAKLAENNVAIVSSDGDVWHAVENSSETGWINADGLLHIDPKREAYLQESDRQQMVQCYSGLAGCLVRRYEGPGRKAGIRILWSRMADQLYFGT